METKKELEKVEGSLCWVGYDEGVHVAGIRITSKA
jgi:hypothetical protein